MSDSAESKTQKIAGYPGVEMIIESRQNDVAFRMLQKYVLAGNRSYVVGFGTLEEKDISLMATQYFDSFRIL